MTDHIPFPMRFFLLNYVSSMKNPSAALLSRCAPHSLSAAWILWNKIIPIDSGLYA